MLDKKSKYILDPNWYEFVTVIDAAKVDEAYSLSEDMHALYAVRDQHLATKNAGRGVAKAIAHMKIRSTEGKLEELGVSLREVAHREVVGNVGQMQIDLSTGLLESGNGLDELRLMSRAIVAGHAVVRAQII